ncbi:hypothetical protein [Leptospira jelokensis]|uniref:Galactose oxidase n=1 Tax=Leptospira jelokensis TaxID=2484931 RepID=A0A4Z1A762_9LEPT|nr:hypothetical protein [Leptospira jelokensis]TGL75683.1 hypothetical protein EHQ62_02335 [Leptospira jelokensis]
MIIYFQTLVLFFVFCLVSCKPGELSNPCDPDSKSYLTGTILRFLVKDSSPSCLPGFPKVPLDLWGVHDANPSNVEILGLAVHDNKVYLGGTFSYFGPNTGAAAILNTTNGQLVPYESCPYLEILSSATVAIPDGENGFYIGGIFTYAKGQNRQSLIHIKSDCQIDTNFNVGTGSNSVLINDLALVGEKLYIAGNFTVWNGVAKNYLAAVNRITGELDLNWTASTNGPVYTFAEDTDGLFLAGAFSNLNGGGFGRLAKVTYDTGATITSFNAGITAGDVRGISLGVNGLGNKVIFAGGNFTIASNFTARAFDMNGNVTSWNPNPNSTVEIVVYYQNKVYLGGFFTTIGGSSRNYFAVVDNANGIVSSENLSLDASSTISHMAIQDGKLYVLGSFSTIFGQERRNAFSIDPLTGVLTDWNPRFISVFSFPYGRMAFSNDGSRVLVPGDFTSVNVVNRNGFGSIDLVTGKPTDFVPSVNGGIASFHLDGDVLYVGGNFTQAFGESRVRFFAYNLKTNRLEGMSPSFDGVVETIKTDGSFVYAGGQFTTANGQIRNRIARYPKLDGTLNSWNPNVSDLVKTILPLGDKLIIGGSFNDIGGFTAQRLGAVSIASGSNLNYPSATIFPNSDVNSLGVVNNLLFFGGTFTNYGVTPSSRFGAIDMSNGTYLSPNLSFDSNVNALGVCENGKGGIGGSFTSVNGTNQQGFVLYDFSKREILSFNPYSMGTIYTIFPNQNKLFFAGSLSEYQRRPKGGYSFVDLENIN